jgi:probable HAF family extracellular repeat protein
MGLHEVSIFILERFDMQCVDLPTTSPRLLIEWPNGSMHAFIFADGVLRDLNDLIPADSSWVLTAAQAINDHGHIVGFGAINGQTHAFLLTPDDDD